MKLNNSGSPKNRSKSKILEYPTASILRNARFSGPSLQPGWSSVVAAACILCAALAGCSDDSKPSTKDVQALITERFGQCPQWSISDIRRTNGAPSSIGYEVSYSFVLNFKAGPDVPEDDARCDLSTTRAAAAKNNLLQLDLFVFTEDSRGKNPQHVPFHTRYAASGDTQFVKSERGWVGRDDPDTSDVTFTAIAASLVNPVSSDSATVNSDPSPSPPASDSSQSPSASSQDDDLPARQRFTRWLTSLIGVSNTVTPDNTTPAPAPALTAVAAGPADTSPSLASPPVAPPAVTPEAVASQPAASMQATASPAADASSVSVASAPIAASQPRTADQTVKPDPDKAALDAQVRAAKLQLLVANGQDQLDTGRYESAIATAQAVLLLDPDNVAAQQLRDAARSSLQKRAQAAPAKPQPHVVATRAPEPVAPAVVAVRTAADFDGNWRGTFSCGDYVGPGTVPHPTGFTQRASMTIRQGHVTLMRSGGGANAFEEDLQGDIQPDLSLRLNGEGHYADTSQKPWTVLYTGRFSADANQPAALKLNGEILTWRGDLSRPCEVTLSR
jgi:hypothetical protein